MSIGLDGGYQLLEVAEHGKMHEMEQRLGDRIDQGTSKVLDVLTSFVSQVQTIDRRQVITSHRVEKLESRMDALDRPNPA